MNMENISKLKRVAAEVSGSSPLTIGKEKMTTEQICSYPRLTVRDFDWISYPDSKTGELVTYPVLIFDEVPDGFYCGGMALSNLCTAIKADDDLYNELKESGLPMKFEATRTKGGNTYVNFTVLDSDDDE